MFLIYDTETTGLPKNFNAPLSDFDNWPRLVQIAWQLHDDNGHLIEAENIIVKPDGFTIPFNAEKIHGISTEMASEQGKPLADVLNRFNQAIAQSKYVIGHNIEFDINIVGCEFLRAEIASDITQKATIDTKNEATEFCALPGGKGGKFKYPTLSEMHEKLFGKKFEEAHNAAADVEATARSFFKLADLKIVQRDDISLDEKIMDHLTEVAKQILSSIDYSIDGSNKHSSKLKKQKAADVENIKATYVHLHNHSQYSVLQATTGVAHLISAAKKDNMTAVALTDAGNMFGAFKFVQGALKEGIKPIVGCEFNLCADRLNKTFKDNGYQIVLLAKHKAGYHNLAKLASKSYMDGFYYVPRIDRKILEEFSEGLIALSGGIYGELASKILNEGIEQAEQALLWWKSVFKDDFYLELNRHGLEEEEHINKILLEWSEKHQVKVVASNNTYYAKRENANAHDILLCVKDGELQSKPKKYVGKRGREYRFGLPNDEFYFKSQQEMKTLFADVPQSIENIQEIVDKVESYALARDVLLPKFDIPDEFKDPEDEKDGGKRGENAFLRHLTYEGAKKRYGELSESIIERLDFELATIQKTGYPGYFLIVQDFTSQARKMGVSVGPGRGSAAGSVVAYAIGITNVDPIKYDLLFERFLNPDRVSMPDIDIDFDDERREWIIKWVVEKYGQEQVAQIITYGTMAAKSAIRDTARVLDLPLPDADKIAKLIPDISLAKLFGPKDQLKGKLNSEGMEKAEQLWAMAKGSGIEANTINQATILEGSVRNTGTHACGVIITPSPITEHIPVLISKDSDLLITQFDNSVVENAGMLKMDFLGLKTLTIIRDAINIIEQRHGVKINPDEISLEDEKTYELYQKGETNGTFQFESAGMQKHLKDLKPDRFEDLIAMNALYRPGPLEYIPNFINRKHGREEIKYDTPQMAEYLEETYGITVYQEQVMLLSQSLAGFTKGEADSLRKGMGKKKKEILDELKPKFLDGCSKNGIAVESAEKIWKDWEAFAAYAFNKSHSTCYSVVAFHTAYLKANYPAEYMASVLTHNMNDIKKVTFFMEECKRMGVPVLGPSVNESAHKFTVNEEGAIRFGLGGIKGVGDAAVEAIIEERTKNGLYKDIWDMATRVNLRSVNKKCFESLALAGSFDCFPNFPRSLYFYTEPNERSNVLERVVRYGADVKNLQATAGNSLFGESAMDDVSPPKLPEIPEWNLMEKLNKEKDVIGFYISGHPLDEYKHEIECFCNSNLQKVAESTNGLYTVGVIVSSAVHRISQQGKKFGSFQVQDFSTTYEFRLFKEAYLKYAHLFVEGEILLIKFNISTFRDGGIMVRVDEAMLMEEAKHKIQKDITLNIPLQAITEESIFELTQLVHKNPGESRLSFNVVNVGDQMQLPLRSVNYKVELNNKLLGKVKELEYINYQITSKN